MTNEQSSELAEPGVGHPEKPFQQNSQWILLGVSGNMLLPCRKDELKLLAVRSPRYLLNSAAWANPLIRQHFSMIYGCHGCDFCPAAQRFLVGLS
jgi:hypothetical protein